MSLPELETQQADLIAEYATDLLLSYDSKLNGRLVNTADIESERAKIQIEHEEDTLEEEMESTSEALIETPIREDEELSHALKIEDIDLANILDLVGIDIQYSGMEICKEYPNQSEPEELVFMMPAKQGKEFVVFSFDLINTSLDTIQVNMLNMQNKYSFELNGEKTKSVLTTMLINDMGTYNGEIEAGEIKTLVLLVEVMEGIVVNDVTLTIKKDDLEINISL